MRFHKQLRLAIFLCIMLPWQHDLQAQTEEDIRTLNQGACWMQQDVHRALRVASFNDQSSFVFDKFSEDKMHQNLRRKLNAFGFDSFASSSYKLWVYCGGAGTKLILDLRDSEIPLCVWYDPLKNDPESFQLYTQYDKLQMGTHCMGELPDKLWIQLHPGTATGPVLDHLQQHYPDVFFRASVSGYPGTGYHLSVALNMQYRFRANVVRERLMKDQALMEHLRRIEYDANVTIAGEAAFAGERTYPGFN